MPRDLVLLLDRLDRVGPRSADDSSNRSTVLGLRYRTWLLGLLLLSALLVVLEARSSVASARAWAAKARTLTYVVEPGPAEDPLPAPAGPHDLRLGYRDLPSFVDSARAAGFVVVQQSRPSAPLLEYVRDGGFYAPYEEKTSAGLELRDASGASVFEARFPRYAYPSFDAIPPIMWETLLWIEDRALLSAIAPTRNPALDWDRLGRAFLELGLRTVDRDRKVPGGSTLATQLEKFRHSPGGRTNGMRDKWQQIVSASTRAYNQGPSTLAARQRIVRDYLNSVPLAARPQFGEVTGIGEGLEAWFGANPDQVNEALRGIGPTAGNVGLEQAEAFRQTLGLILSQRRPSYYLTTADGPTRLVALTDRYLRLLEAERVISSQLAEAALSAEAVAAPSERMASPPSTRAPSREERKALNVVRARLATLLGVDGTYALDRLDLEAGITLDASGQSAAAGLLQDLRSPASELGRQLRAQGLMDASEPQGILYSVLLMESTPQGNAVRVDIDNLPGQASLNDAGRLELGSTAKLRTLITYLETVAETYDRLTVMDPGSFAALDVHPRDPLTRWVVRQLEGDPRPERPAIIARAMGRRFRADPNERFATGGGVQTFRNFDSRFDGELLSVTEAFRHSTNLVFVRMLRDVVDHLIFAPWAPTSEVMAAADSVRRPYLVQFARSESRTYLRRFYRKYEAGSPEGIHGMLLENRRTRPLRAARALRWIEPDMDRDGFVSAIRGSDVDGLPPDVDVDLLFRQSSPEGLTLLDVAYLSSVHPLELWVARYLLERGDATLDEVLDGGEELAEEVYGWLLDRSGRSRQDPRIYAVLEAEAFGVIHDGWRRLGYPYRNLVPSIGTAIGSSGDRPAALAELVGIVLNEGQRRATVRVTDLQFAKRTPYEVALQRRVTPEPVLDPTIATVVREAMLDVVRSGTARRASGALRGPDGQPLLLGAKTGTGDNRSRGGTSGDGSRVLNRTSTLVFFAGDRWFGVVTAYVPGAEAAGYRFTSALASQVLVEFGRRWSPT